MKILEYGGLDIQRVKAPYRKVCEAIARGDFHAAQVKKLVHGDLHGLPCYRARLNDADRLLFTLVRHGDEVCALMLEVIAHHQYDKSRFLRGAQIDPQRIDAGAEADAATECQALRQAPPLRYLHPEQRVIHLLDKPLSFNDAQDEIYRRPPPLILVGSAGSGKTALILEKLKHAAGEVLYVTHSAYLAQNARDLYYAHGFEHPGQDAAFLSYRELVESIRVPAGREAEWRDFAAWFARIKQGFRGIDAHQAFEEIRGVIAAGAGGVLGRADYLALGVRQSIFPAGERERLYALFDKYRAWLAEAGLFDLNLVAQEWRALAAPRYDFVVVDEVQDLTAAQLALVLATRKPAGQFLLCGDSNQIVHPNFFSWSQVKSLFWRDPELARQQELAVLSANFRNSPEATRVANTLLKIRQRRFGAIDRESSFLVDAVGGEAGAVMLLTERDETLAELAARSRRSTRFAVLVMRDEDKPAARARFSTPLLFSIHEAKGLEYDNIVLYRFVSDHPQAFADIAQGVSKADLAAHQLDYHRARDKEDKSLEIYKFFVNALYVALTRATRNLYLVESDTTHPLLALLELAEGGTLEAAASASSLEEWQKEARKLEAQGKQEQADAIERDILGLRPVPWSVIDEARVLELLHKTFNEKTRSHKPRQLLYEYATCHDEPELARHLLLDAGFEAASAFPHQLTTLGRKSWVAYFQRNFQDILRQCEQHGIEHRLPMNQTPLMAAAAAGNVALVEALLERGASRETSDHYGWNALHWALREAFRDPAYARGPFAAVFERVAPAGIDLQSGERLMRLDRQHSPYLLFQTMWTLFRSRFTTPQRQRLAAFEVDALLKAWQFLPAAVLRPERRQRHYLSGLLARNVLNADYASNRQLFVRMAHGCYQLNPELAVRLASGAAAGEWQPLYQALNLPLVAEFTRFDQISVAIRYSRAAQVAIDPRPLLKAPLIALGEAIERKDEAADRMLEEARRHRQGCLHPILRDWLPALGTPEAKIREIRRLRARIAEYKARKKARG